jgi:hypothetical protein
VGLTVAGAVRCGAVRCRGFDRMMSFKGVNAYGMGAYFTCSALLADRYSAFVHSEVDGTHCNVMVMAKVLVGEYTQVSPRLGDPVALPQLHLR